MKNIKQVNLRHTNKWLSGDIDIRVPKRWLAIGAAILFALILMALN